jgi:ComEC/Rec2-related protein
VGDGVRVVSRLKAITNSERRQNGHFDNVRYQHVHGIVARTYINKGGWKRCRVSMRKLGLMLRVLIGMRSGRDRLLSQCNLHNMSESAYAVVAAMTMGDRSGLTRELRQSYAASGASHVLALSGMHLGVIYGLLSLLFVHHRMRVLGQVLAMVVIWAYATLVGMPPSVLRSATMLTIFAFVVLTGRRQVSLNTLAFAAVVQLAINPLGLWDVGFQMSFLAVLGIVMLNLRLRDVATPIWLSRWRVIWWMWSLVKVSLAAQIAVAPLSMYYFGTFPCYFLLTNLIAVPLAMLILYSSVVMYLLVFLVWHRGLAIPRARNLNNARVQQGKKVFNEIGCASCHRPSWKTGSDNYWTPNMIAGKKLPRYANQTIYPYSDMMQHKLYMINDIHGSWCRTTPLWGRGLAGVNGSGTERLHDCRARNEIEAIMWHAYSKNSHAYNAALKFYNLSKADRDAVVMFLRSI